MVADTRSLLSAASTASARNRKWALLPSSIPLLAVLFSLLAQFSSVPFSCSLDAQRPSRSIICNQLGLTPRSAFCCFLRFELMCVVAQQQQVLEVQAELSAVLPTDATSRSRCPALTRPVFSGVSGLSRADAIGAGARGRLRPWASFSATERSRSQSLHHFTR